MAENPPSKAPVVLVVEDEELVRRSIARALEVQGFTVLVAESAQEALTVAGLPAGSIDVLVMDIMLPDSWGTRLAEDLKALHPDLGVVFTSGYTETDPILEAGMAQRKPFLRKPFGSDELLAAIDTVMTRH